MILEYSLFFITQAFYITDRKNELLLSLLYNLAV